ncbi:glycosyltransferase [Polynucleobacter paneuropaeus]|nr:glycosyltransferase [Polynucleobacter paneuropaeus]
MKILFNTYPVAFQTPGGGEVQLLEYKKYISDSDIDIDFFNQWQSKIKQYDLVHFFSCMPGSEYFLHYVKNLGVPVFISPNLWVTEETKNNYPFGQIQSHLNMADRVVCNSESECNLLSKVFEVPMEKFICVYNGVEELFFESVDPKIFRDYYQILSPFILNVANIEPRKNQLNLVRAIKKFPEYKLVIMGGIRDQAYADKVISEGGSQLIIIERQEHGSEMQRSAYAACDLFALPSTLETPGLAALEAGACGAPILITQEGCTQEYFSHFAVYVDPNSLASIEGGIRSAFSKSSPELRDLIEERFTWKKVLQPLIQHYKNKLFFGNSIISKGFFLSEKNAEGPFIWSKYRAHLEIPQGILTFQWRAPQRSKVNIYLNHELYQSDVEVGIHWENFSISTMDSKNSSLNSIEFEVIPIESVSHGNARELGFAISAPLYLSKEELVDQSFLNHWYLENNKYLEAFNVQKAWGFNLPEVAQEGPFIWSKYHAHLEIPQGILTFQWRAPQRSKVNIYLNHELYQSDVEVGIHWENFSISTMDSKNSSLNSIEFEVIPIESVSHGNARELGFAISAPLYLSKEELVDQSFLNHWYLENNKYLEAFNVQKAWGFNLPEVAQEGPFIWSKYHAHLEIPQGILTFQWRAPQRSKVNIYLNHELYQSDVEVGIHWENFSISTMDSKNSGLNSIEFEVVPVQPVTHGDSRELGIGLLNLIFENKK